MRIGTFMCWLFGHKFIARTIEFRKDESHPDGYRRHIKYFPISHCVRCGIDKKG